MMLYLNSLHAGYFFTIVLSSADFFSELIFFSKKILSEQYESVE